MVIVWLALLVLGLVVAALASRRAVTSALEISESLGVSAGLVGVTVMAIGTDLPEIATSVMAAIQGHGDLLVGDATGSALTQITLILAILMFAGSSRLDVGASGSTIAITAGSATVVALVGVAVMVSDGRVSRVDGVILITAWIAGLVVVHRRERAGPGEPPEHHITSTGLASSTGRTIMWLLVVGGASWLVVHSFIETSDSFGIPEFIASAIVLSLGTSMPELVVDWTAIRRGASALAIGDLFGSSLVDSTLSIGVGPVIRSVAVSPDVLIGTLVIAIGCAMATATVAFAAGPRRTASWLLVIYGAASVALVAIAA